MSTPWVDGNDDAVFDLEDARDRDEGSCQKGRMLEATALLDSDIHVVREVRHKDPCICFAPSDERVRP